MVQIADAARKGIPIKGWIWLSERTLVLIVLGFHLIPIFRQELSNSTDELIKFLSSFAETRNSTKKGPKPFYKL